MARDRVVSRKMIYDMVEVVGYMFICDSLSQCVLYLDKFL